MKKGISLVILALALSLVMAVCGCSGTGEDQSADPFGACSRTESEVQSRPQTSESTSEPSAESSVQSAPESSVPAESPGKVSDTSEASQKPETSAPVKLPEGVSRVSKGKLRFTSSVLSLSATFPEEFCVLNTDYTPKYGIYLQNTDGTATLLAESVEDNTLTYRQMSEYLKDRYPDARVYTTDQKDVICKMITTDQSGNEIYVFQRIKCRKGGYNEIALCCRPEDQAKYERVFNETSLSR